MSKKLKQRVNDLIEGKEWKELEDLLLNTEEEWTLEIVGRVIRTGEGSKYVGGLLKALSCDTRESTALRLKIYEGVLEEVRQHGGENNRSAGDLMRDLMLHVDTFPTNTIITLINLYIERVQNGQELQGRWMDLLSKLVTSVSVREKVVDGGKEMTGEDYRYQVVHTLCDLPWNAETTIALLPVIKDMDLPKEELEDVIHKVERVLRKVEYQSVPPIIYHLILMVMGKLMGRVLQLAIDYFNTQEKKLEKKAKKRKEKESEMDSLELDSEAIEDSRLSELTEAKGNVILHVTHLAQNNPELVKDYLKFVKFSTWLTERLITPFNLALSLSLASIKKYEEQILDSLKSCLLKSFHQEERSQQSQWLRETWGDTSDHTTVFKTTIDNCNMGWDQVSLELVQLAFNLLKSGNGPKGETYVSQRAISLAGIILPLILKKQPHIAYTVLSQLSNNILCGSVPMQYVGIFRKLVKTSPLVLLVEHVSVIRELLENLAFLPLNVSQHLLHTLLPLLKMNMSLKDSLMILLRKMLFSKNIEGRQVAVHGYLQFLRHFRVMGTLPSSQSSLSFCSTTTTVSADVHTVFNTSTNEALCLEMLGLLRRCFTQQHQVKSTLYSGLYNVSRSNPKMTVNILELQLQHIKLFLDLRPDIFNPVMLKKVVSVHGDSAVLVEPIADLLASLGSIKTNFEENKERILTEDDDEDSAISILNEICSIFDVLTEKLAGCGLDDLGFDPNGDYSNSSAVGQKNLLLATEMIGVFDCLMEHTFTHGAEREEEKMQTLISLFKSQRKVIDLVKERGGKPGKKGESSKEKKGEGSKEKKGEGSKSRGRTAAKVNVTFRSRISTRTTSRMLTVSLSAEDDVSQMLRDNHDLQMYLLSIIEEMLTSIKGRTDTEMERVLPDLRAAGKVLLQECTKNIGNPDSSDEREVGRLRQTLHVLSTLFDIFCKHYKDKLDSILTEVLGKTDKDVDAQLLRLCKRCQKMLLKIIHHEEREPLMKDGCHIVQLMTAATRAMDQDSDNVALVQDWILQLCKDQELTHTGLAEALMTLAFSLSNQVKANHTLTRGIARELHHRLGDLEHDVEVAEAGKYKIVTEETACANLTTLLSHIEDSLGLIDMALNKMKTCLTTGAEYDADKVEKLVAQKCAIVMHAIHEVIQSALPLGANTDNTLKVVTKLYNVLSLYVKYYLDLYRLKNYAQISDKFERVVHMSGELVSGPIYPCITYIEGTQRQLVTAGKQKEGTLKARAIKEFRLIPSLIFAIEQYEKHLINLSRKSKVNLMQGMKISTSRDFRIMPEAIMEALRSDEEDVDQDETEVEIGGQEEEEEEAGEQSRDTDNESRSRHSGSDDEDETHVEAPPPTVKDNKGAKNKKSARRDDEGDENNVNAQNVDQPPPKKKRLGMKRT